MLNNLSQIVYKFLRHFLPGKKPGMGFENVVPAPGSDNKWLCTIRQIPKPTLSSSAWLWAGVPFPVTSQEGGHKKMGRKEIWFLPHRAYSLTERDEKTDNEDTSAGKFPEEAKPMTGPEGPIELVKWVQEGPGFQQSGHRSLFHHLSAAWPRLSHLLSLTLYFLTSKDNNLRWKWQPTPVSWEIPWIEKPSTAHGVTKELETT